MYVHIHIHTYGYECMYVGIFFYYNLPTPIFLSNKKPCSKIVLY